MYSCEAVVLINVWKLIKGGNVKLFKNIIVHIQSVNQSTCNINSSGNYFTCSECYYGLCKIVGEMSTYFYAHLKNNNPSYFYAILKVFECPMNKLLFVKYINFKDTVLRSRFER